MDMYVVVKQYNEFNAELHAFSDLEKAKAYFKKMLEELFQASHTDVDDNGNDIDYCVEYYECLLDDHHHYIEHCTYHG